MSNLPELPRKNKRIEAKLDTKVALEVAKLHPIKNWALEVKLWNNTLEPHQEVALKQVEKGTFKPYKIRDMGQKNPFDFFHLGDADAIVCIIQKNKKDVCCIVNDNYTFNIKI